MAAAADLFIEYLERRERGEALELEAFCAAHPAEAEDLRRLAATLAQIDSKLARGMPSVSLREHLESLHGSGTARGIDLQARDEMPRSEMPRSDMPRTDVLARLGERTPGSGRYRACEEVARGGQGVVLRVWDEDLRRNLAMKVMHARLAESGRPGSGFSPITRFLEEALITGQLDHPGIVPVHELGLDEESRCFFVMKLVRGQSLKAVFDLVQRGAEGWNRTRVLGVLLKVCEAMAYAHSKGVVHRDLKPANVMVGRFGEVYVMDWGLARVQGREDRRDLRISEPELTSQILSERRAHAEGGADSPLVTMDGHIVGTPAYMAPEQALGKLDEIGPHSDVYALGAMLYHLIAGHAPYLVPGTKLSNHAVWYRAQEGPPDALHQRAPQAPAELIAICEKAMARKAEERYPDMLGLAEDLRAYLENRVVRAYETGAVAELRKWVGRNQALATSLAAALALALLGLGGVGYVQAAGKRAAEAERQIVLRLSDVKRLSDYEREAEALWPASPAQVPRLEAWLVKAEALAGNLPMHRSTLAALRTQALEPTSGGDEAGPRFADTETQWQHDTLAGLVADLSSFTDSDPHRGAIASVRARLDFASQVETRTLLEPRAAWEQATSAIAADPRYAGLRIRPQLGLVPIGRDPDSGLWEFAHLQTGAVAERDERGHLVPSAGDGLVFVLLPGGTFTMGAQAADPSGPNYDPLAKADEAPPQRVTLAPFFLAKFELTQAQWTRITGKNPSQHHPPDGGWKGGTISALHPVEQVSWDDCQELFRKLALDFPSEAQWEYAARAGTSTPWPTGREKESLQGASNLADHFAGAQGAPWTPVEEWLDDGWVTHAPVGTFAPNAFGLHEMTGNVWEWCRDGFGSYAREVEGDDAVRRADDLRMRIVRGSGFDDLAQFARSASRLSYAPDSRYYALGVRPVRALERDEAR